MEEGIDPNASQAPSIEDLAALFPAYQFEKFIAEGGMGAVYLARQISLDRPVAIKILARELGEDPVFRASFEAEAKAMARLNHPNLIGVFDFGEADGMLFIVMEMVDGNSLHDSAYGRTIDPVQAAGMVSAISRGLEHAHNAGILHRDIKPGNILLDAEGNPKIGDFGLAQPMGQKSSEDEQIYGTPGYTAPEVYQRKGDHRADIYSVGILLHELLTGKLPDGSGTPPSILCGCSRAFDAIVARATNANPLIRYASAGELADELDKAALAADATNASTNRLVLPSARPAVAVGAGKSASRARVQAQIHAQKAESKGPLIAIVALCVLLGIGLVIMLAGRGSGGGAPDRRASADRPTPGSTPGAGGAEGRPATGGGEPDVGLGSGAVVPTEELVGGGAALPGDSTHVGGGENPPPKPSPKAALAVLKEKLAGGSRDEFPPGAEARDGSHFLLVDERMGWWEAKAYAEAHGAHLAILPEQADRKWFHENFPSGEPVWVGGGRASNDRWQWLDGSAWTSGAKPVADAARRQLAIGASGALLAESEAESFQVALQWRDDASNPASTGAQLRRTVESIKPRGVENAIYPVGTRSYSELNSHFFLVPKVASWEEAHKLAKAAGGTLAVPSSKAESDWLRESFAVRAEGGMTLWLGGFRRNPGEPWRWLTGEAWNHPAGWAGGAEPLGSTTGRLMLQLARGGGGWVASDGAEGAADGILIEWSPPKKAASIASFDLESWLDKIDETFAALVQGDIDDYNKAHGLAIDRYIRTVERLGRKHTSALAGQEGRQQDRIREAIEDAVREVEKSGTLLPVIPKSAPDDFHELQEKTKKSLAELRAEFQKKLSGHVASYAQGLIEQSGRLAADGYTEAVNALKARVDSIGGEGAKLLNLFALDDPTATAVAAGDEGAADPGE